MKPTISVRNRIQYVEAQRPVLDVVEVVNDALVHGLHVAVSPRRPFTWAQPVMPGLTR